MGQWGLWKHQGIVSGVHLSQQDRVLAPTMSPVSGTRPMWRTKVPPVRLLRTIGFAYYHRPK